MLALETKTSTNHVGENILLCYSNAISLGHVVLFFFLPSKVKKKKKALTIEVF